MNVLLFIDDEEGMRRSVVRALQRESFRVVAVESGQAGVRFVEEHGDDIATVICDLKMPEMDGLTALIQIGRINPEITRIILTGYATVDAAIGATNEGIDGFLTKPFDNRELRAKIHEITIRKRLRQFVSEPVYREITDSTAALSPRFHEASILFSDIRNFTAMTQQKDAGEIARFLNEHYFTPMDGIIHAHRGTTDKHIGDAIMAVFGAPVSAPDDARRCLEAAVAMQNKTAEINASLPEASNLKLNIGIGIATGEVFSGLLGSHRKREFTSIGMAVNMASRMQRLAAGGDILICEATRMKAAGRFATEPLKPIQIKGIGGMLVFHRLVRTEGGWENKGQKGKR